MPAGGYEHTPTGIEWIKAKFRDYDSQLKSIKSAAGILSAVIGKGGVTVKDGGSIALEDGGGINIQGGGAIGMGPGSKFFVAGDDTYVQILDDSFSIGTISSSGGLVKPSMILMPDGFLAAISDTQYAVFRVDATTGDAVVTSSTGRVHLPYQNTGDSANTRILFDGTILMVTSSLRYKQDVEDADIDPAAVLKMRRRTWRQKSDVEADPDTTVRYIGFIAEELHELGLTQFVEYDDQDRPNAIRYDRLTVALHALAESQQEQIDGLTRRVEALESPTT